MAHLHDVLDDDPHFKIDADSREIIRTSEKELLLIQDDHNSERCTFDIPKLIDGHDMALCNVIRVHFINVNAENPTETSLGLYEVDDLRVSPNDPSTMVFSWLISSEGTALIGTLSFLVEFICKNDEDVIEYSWHTGIYTGGIVSKGMNNSEIVIGQHYDVLNRWVALIEQEGDRVRTDVLNRINDAANQAEKNSVDAINSHAETVKKDLALHGLAINDLLVQETGNSTGKIMSQASVTEEINRLDGEINEQITGVRSDFNTFKTEMDDLVSDAATYKELPITTVDGKKTINIEVGKTYFIKSNSSFVFKFKSMSFHGSDGTQIDWNSGWNFESIENEYTNVYYTLRLVSIALTPAFIGESQTYSIFAKTVYEINGKEVTKELEVGVEVEDDNGPYVIDSSEYVVEGCDSAYLVNDPRDIEDFKQYVVKANGITSITKTNTAVVDGVVTHTYVILLDDGTKTTFDVKDGVGISSFSLYSYGDYENTYKVEFTNGTSMEFKVPNNNTVGIRTSDSGPMIHAEDLIPLDHVIRTKARSKNMIPYPYATNPGSKSGIEFSIDESDNGIVMNGTATANTSYDFVSRTRLNLLIESGKTYTFSCLSDKLTSAVGYVYFQLYAKGATSPIYTVSVLGNESITFTSKWTGYANMGVVIKSGAICENDKVLVQVEENNVATSYTPYVDLTTVTLTRCRKNLIAHPYYDKKTEYNGITITDNAGILTFNGTATADSSYTLFRKSIMPVNGKYTLSGVTGGSATTFYMQPYVNGVAQQTVMDGPVTYEWHGSITQISIFFKAGTSFDNLIISPQLEVGDTATEFERYRATTHGLTSGGGPVPLVESDALPIINLLTDKEGVIIDATYNVDQTAAYNKINALLEILVNGGA